MNLGIWILIVTFALLYNIYYDGYLVKTIKEKRKFLEMAVVAFVGMTLYIFMKKHPSESSSMLKYASGVVKHIPIDKNSKGMLLPVFDFTRNRIDNTYMNGNMKNVTTNMAPSSIYSKQKGGNEKGIFKRSVSESRKKFVASNQNWKCDHCKSQLDATFEVDHVVELQDGGNNEVSNLVALCRNCHGKKTLMNRLNK